MKSQSCLRFSLLRYIYLFSLTSHKQNTVTYMPLLASCKRTSSKFLYSTTFYCTASYNSTFTSIFLKNRQAETRVRERRERERERETTHTHTHHNLSRFYLLSSVLLYCFLPDKQNNISSPSNTTTTTPSSIVHKY